MEKGVNKRVHRNAMRTGLVMLAATIAALIGAPSALADDPCLPENGCVPGVVEPPLDPDQAGNPQTMTIDWQIPDVPPSVTVDIGLPSPPTPKHKTCKQKRKHAASKKCKSGKAK